MKDYINNLNLFRLQPSKIHGLGVFAIEDIKKGTIIDQVKPLVMSKKIFYLMLIFLYFFKFFKIKDSTNILKILFYTNLGVYFIPSITSYLNHGSGNTNVGYSYEPNFGFSFFAIANIKKGEELLLKYRISPKNFK